MHDTPAGPHPLRVVALTVGEPHAAELWTLHRLSSLGVRLSVVQAEHAFTVGARKRLMRLVRTQGVIAATSRTVGSRVFADLVERRASAQLDALFDADHLKGWWRACGIDRVTVPHLNDPVGRASIADLRPDILVRVSGGILTREIFELARLVTLNIHHGLAPEIRGMWSMHWAIIEGRPGWIGATVHRIDAGIDTGPIFWRGSPQIAPGDTATTLFFRAHLQAVDALGRVIAAYASGETPEVWRPRGSVESAYRSGPGVIAWLRFLLRGAGRWSTVTFERAVRS
jgi:hypothetical protein